MVPASPRLWPRSWDRRRGQSPPMEKIELFGKRQEGQSPFIAGKSIDKARCYGKNQGSCIYEEALWVWKSAK